GRSSYILDLSSPEQPRHLLAAGPPEERAQHTPAEEQRDEGERPVLVVVPEEDHPHDLRQRREAEDGRLELAPRAGERREEDHEGVIITRELAHQDDEDLRQTLRHPERFHPSHDEEEIQEPERGDAMSHETELVVALVSHPLPDLEGIEELVVLRVLHPARG